MLECCCMVRNHGKEDFPHVQLETFFCFTQLPLTVAFFMCLDCCLCCLCCPPPPCSYLSFKYFKILYHSKPWGAQGDFLQSYSSSTKQVRAQGPASHVLVADSYSSRAMRNSPAARQGCTKGEIQPTAKPGRELWLTLMVCYQWFQKQDGLRSHHGLFIYVRTNILIAWGFCMLAADLRDQAWLMATFSSCAATMASFCSWKHPED